MPLYILEEVAVKAVYNPPPNHPVWKLFKDSPILRLEGLPFLRHGEPFVFFDQGGGCGFAVDADAVQLVEDGE